MQPIYLRTDWKWEALQSAALEQGASEVEAEGLDAGRVVSILVAIVCMAVAHSLVKHEILHLSIAVLVLPLGCIWYGSEIGFFVGMPATGEDNPGNAIGTAIKIVGWIVLFAILAGLILLALSE